MSTDTANPANPVATDAPHEVVVKCPATGQVVGSVPVSTAEEVGAAAARLRAAQPAWQQMGLDRQPGRTISPVQASPELDAHVGEWVAVRAGHVIAFAASSSELVAQLRDMGSDARGASAQFVAPPVPGYKVGVG